MSDSQVAAMQTYAGIPTLGSSSPDAPIVDHARIRIRASADIIAARQQSRAIASLLGFSNSDLTMITTAISEVARNIVDYANVGSGHMHTCMRHLRSLASSMNSEPRGGVSASFTRQSPQRTAVVSS